MGLVKTPAPFTILAVVAATALLLAACGGGSKAVGGRLPSCVHPGSAVTAAGGLAQFPLPSGAVLDRSRTEFGQKVLEGYVAGKLTDVRDYYQEQLPKHGYTLGAGDAEDNEAETDFSGHGVNAHLKLHDIAGCSGALTIAITRGD